mgnify:CR=1 FL=1
MNKIYIVINKDARCKVTYFFDIVVSIAYKAMGSGIAI